MLGLCINVAKSTLFAAGRGKLILEAEAGTLGLTTSALPMRYLGLQLTTKLMSILDYEPLVDKIRTRLLKWTSRHFGKTSSYQFSDIKHIKFLVLGISIAFLVRYGYRRVDSLTFLVTLISGS